LTGFSLGFALRILVSVSAMVRVLELCGYRDFDTRYDTRFIAGWEQTTMVIVGLKQLFFI
jgi:hypothetical protein